MCVCWCVRLNLTEKRFFVAETFGGGEGVCVVVMVQEEKVLVELVVPGEWCG